MRKNNFKITCDFCGWPTLYLFDVDDGCVCIDCISGWE